MRHLLAILFLFTSIISLAQDQLWGVTSMGGVNNAGTIFHVNTDGTNHTVVKAFSAGANTPYGSLTLGSNNELFGMTSVGGEKNRGVIFKLNSDGTSYTVLHDFLGEDGARPLGSLIVGKDGKLYGVTNNGGSSNKGVIFKMNQDGSGYTKIFDFSTGNGAGAAGSLIQDAAGDLFGITVNDGDKTLFKIKPDGSGYTHLHDFNAENDLNFLYSSPTEGSEGFIYGIGLTISAEGGGIFKVKKDGTNYSIIHSLNNTWTPGGQLLSGLNGKMYGFAGNSIFSINPDGSEYYEFPASGLSYNIFTSGKLIQDADGYIYGLTDGGNCFKVDSDGLSSSILHQFVMENNGNDFGLVGQLIMNTEGKLFGMTFSGGEKHGGTIFSINKDGSSFALLHHFNPTGGLESLPGSILIRSKVSNKIFGYAGGEPNGCGSIFQINLDGTEYSKLYEFDQTNGCGISFLMEDKSGNLWGVTNFGGVNKYDGIFKLRPDGTNYSKIVTLSDKLGSGSHFSFIQGPDNNLYGLAKSGGTTNDGAIFKVLTSTSELVKLKDFDGTTTSGIFPTGNLIYNPDGFLYGKTFVGGGSGKTGVFFKIKPDGSEYTHLHDFVQESGVAPDGDLYLSSDSFFYGTTRGGGPNINSQGFLYKMKKDGTNYETLYNFEAPVQMRNTGIVVDTSHSILYGLQEPMAQVGDGALFSIKLDGTGYSEFYKFSGEDGSIPIGNLVFVKDLITATETPNSLNAIQVFPNPTTGRIKLSGIKEIKAVQAINLLGKSYSLSPECITYSCDLDLSNLDSGFYLLKISTNRDKVITKKIMVVK
ncbi:MAG: choice-of-anchor tandem repeat GloVer-containing protein [Chryseolinea sp.]